MHSYARTLPLFIIAFIVLGAGCGTQQAGPAATQQDEGAAEYVPAEAPEHADHEFEQASVLDKGFVQGMYERNGNRMLFRVPQGWVKHGSVWRPSAEDRINHIRAAHFDSGPETEWKKQQELDVHDVVLAEQREDGYLLLVNHPGLKATILKIFIPDPQDDARSHYFAECRIGYDADREDLWDVCATFVDSLKVE